MCPDMGLLIQPAALAWPTRLMPEEDVDCSSGSCKLPNPAAELVCVKHTGSGAILPL